MKSSQILLRSGAILFALTAIVDPGFDRQTSGPVPIVVRAASHEAADQELAVSLRARLASLLYGQVDVDSYLAPAAVVVAGDTFDADMLPDGIPVSSVAGREPESPNVRIAGTSTPGVLLAGWTTRLSATVTATGMAGRTSVIVLEHRQVEIGRLEHAWISDMETFEATFTYLPPAPGIMPIRLTARTLEGEVTSADNHADLRLMIEDRVLKILVHEPRPSWAAAFIRRALEEVPLFEVATLVRPSRGIEVRAGDAPLRIAPEALEAFDAVIVGAPEELSDSEVDALATFARLRGGTFILVPDRRPAGPYLSLIPAASFDERLLERASAASGTGGRLEASEFAVPTRMSPAVDVLADLVDAKGRAPIVIAWPVGAGRGVYSGALDAWRHRASGGGFADFWRAQVAGAASAAPRRIEVALDPALAAPGQIVTLRVRVRETEFSLAPQSIRLPIVSANRTDRRGTSEPIRLWPTAEPGLFEARFPAPPAGQYAIEVSSAGGVAFDGPLIVSPDARTPAPSAQSARRLLVDATGGVSTTDDELSVLESHLAGLPRASATRSIRPARSPWWMAAFVLLLCAEWGLRRRGGAR